MNRAVRGLKARVWTIRGRLPHAYGYNPARWLTIERNIARGDDRYGWDGGGFDERVVEYPWVFHRIASLRGASARVLDAGSVMNYPRVLDWWRAAGNPPLSIVTLAFEGHARVAQDVRYEFADLRHLPYRDEWFSTVVCLSTIEHVGLDNTVYGAGAERSGDPAAEAARAMAELRRVTARGGTLLLSVPFGARSNRGWFRIFDEADVRHLAAVPGWSDARVRYFRAMREGWRECTAAEAATAGYNEPSGAADLQTAPPWVAGAEAVALLEAKRG
jgi:SAM-dependent methyltransferase